MAHPSSHGIEAMKHSWLRIHLSTALVLMLAASALLWANMREVESWERLAERKSEERYLRTDRRCQGWPFAASGVQVTSLDVKSDTFRELRLPGMVLDIWEPKYLAANIFIALLILASLAALCEWRIRRWARVIS